MYWERRFPRLLTTEQLHDLMSKGCPLIGVSDISCDIGGSIEFVNQTTSIDSPFFRYYPFYCLTYLSMWIISETHVSLLDPFSFCYCSEGSDVHCCVTQYGILDRQLFSKLNMKKSSRQPKFVKSIFSLTFFRNHILGTK